MESAGSFGERQDDLGNGHAVIDTPRRGAGRSRAGCRVGRGQARPEIDALRGLIKRFGEERGTRIAEFSRNMLIFPNLVINDIMAITMRTFFPRRRTR